MADYSIEAHMKANVDQYRKALQTAKKVTENFKRTSDSVEDTELDADASSLMSNVKKAKKTLKNFESIKAEAEANADISPLRRNMKKAKALMATFLNKNTEKEINIKADTTDFRRKSAQVARKARDLVRDKVIVHIGASANSFMGTLNRIQDRLDTLANSIRTVGTVAGSSFRGLGVAASSAAVPIIASLVPAIMAAGNALGVLVGASAGLMSSFTALAGAGGAFAVAAIGNAAKLTESMEEIDKLNEKIAKERESLDPNQDKINEMLHERANILSKLSDKQIAAQKQLRSFRQGWSEFLAETEKPVFQVFAAGLEVATSLLHELKPIIQPVSDTLTDLLNKFNYFSKGEQFRSFIDFFAGRGTTAIQNWGKISGNIMLGFMELMKAFGPLGASMEQGLIAMTQRFADWATTISQSEGFQNFVSYVQTNMPIIRRIFGDTFKGIINLFASFGDNSAIIFQRLAEMAVSFRTWSETVKQSDGFQQFIKYVQENGPGVIALIGNFIEFIINLGIALAPLGATMLEIINNVISFTSALMENHPVVGKVVAAMTVLFGSLIAIAPLVIALQTAFGGLGAVLLKGVGAAFTFLASPIDNIKKAFTTLRTRIAPLAAKTLPLLRGGLMALAGPVGIVIGVLTLLIPVFARLWNENEKFRSGVQQAWAIIQSVFSNTVAIISTTVMSVIGALVSWWQSNQQTFYATAQRVWDMVYNAVSTVLSTLWGFVQQITVRIQAIWAAHGENIMSVARSAWQTISNLVSTFTSIISSVIKGALGVIQGIFQVTWPIISGVVQTAWAVISTAVEVGINLVLGIIDTVMSLLSGNWEDAWETIKETATSIMESIVSTFENVNLVEIGENIIQGLIKGIKNMATSVVSAAKGVVNGAIQGAKNLLGINSPSKLFRGFGENTFEGYIIGAKKMKNRVADVSKRMAATASDSFSPDYHVNSSQITSSLRGVRRKSTAQVQSAVNADISVNNRQPANINLSLGGRDFSTFVRDISSTQERDNRMKQRAQGRG